MKSWELEAPLHRMILQYNVKKWEGMKVAKTSSENDIVVFVS